ncbi:MAG: baseplate J/gp47 family protein [Symbiobacteriaceae bacterium]|nr:baseplate J/gp47 family protein [Symbiobacteriaceae bacterium]
MIPEHLYITAEEILATMLATVPNTVDKRLGAIIYDTLAAAAQQLATSYKDLRNVYTNTYVKTAEDEYLDLRVGESGLQRRDATAAIRQGLFYGAEDTPFPIPIGARFAAIGETTTFIATQQLAAGIYQLQCEQLGSVGNNYLGQLLPITHIPELHTARLEGILIPGSDTESNESLLARYLEQLQIQPFAGNIVAYRDMILSLPGVGGVQVYPVWNGGGTVKCSIIDSSFNPPSETLVEGVQDTVDPLPQGMGKGRAPIDHLVTIQGAVGLPVTVSAVVTVGPGFTLEQLSPLITESLEKYFLEIRKEWDKLPPRGSLEYISWIFRARVNSTFFAVPGVQNVEELKLNGDTWDIKLEQSGTKQEIPLLEGVVLTAP